MKDRHAKAKAKDRRKENISPWNRRVRKPGSGRSTSVPGVWGSRVVCSIYLLCMMCFGYGPVSAYLGWYLGVHWPGRPFYPVSLGCHHPLCIYDMASPIGHHSVWHTWYRLRQACPMSSMIWPQTEHRRHGDPTDQRITMPPMPTGFIQVSLAIESLDLLFSFSIVNYIF